MIVDTDIHVAPGDIEALTPYLEAHWIDYFADVDFRGPVDTAYPPGAPTSLAPWARRLGATGPASTPASLSEHLLDRLAVDRAVLSCDYDLVSLHNPDLSDALARAVNDWLVAEWLPEEPRVRLSLLVVPHQPALAAREIERLGQHPAVVAVALPVRTSVPYGNRVYGPLFAAATEHGLVVALHFGGSPGMPPTSVGWPSYYVEEHAGMATAFQAQLMSMIYEGLFDRFPGLRVALVESGWSWLPAFTWRLDKDWRGLRREVPWVRQPPSEYIRRHVRLTLQPADGPSDETLLASLVDDFRLHELIMFSSDFPHWHVDNEEDVVRLPACMQASDRLSHVLETNARAFYRL